MSERQENLERWAELEPERCRLSPIGANPNRFYVKRGESGAYLHLLDVTIERDDDTLLGSLIEAVTARRWKYGLQFGGAKHEAVVEDPLNRFHQGRAKTPADALLAAYVSCLSAN